MSRPSAGIDGNTTTPTSTGLAKPAAAEAVSSTRESNTSSLVTTHYACQSLWNENCELAITGGVNVMLRPEYFAAMSKGRFLSPDGSCKMFDARANGYVHGEGAGVALLKPVIAALRDDDPIYAVIRACGVNQDGQTAGPFRHRHAGLDRGRLPHVRRGGPPPGTAHLDQGVPFGRPGPG